MFTLQKIKNTAQDESGAVTVDWVVLTAATVGMVAALSATIEGGMQTVAADISAAMRLEAVEASVNAPDE